MDDCKDQRNEDNYRHRIRSLLERRCCGSSSSITCLFLTGGGGSFLTSTPGGGTGRGYLRGLPRFRFSTTGGAPGTVAAAATAGGGGCGGGQGLGFGALTTLYMRVFKFELTTLTARIDTISAACASSYSFAARTIDLSVLNSVTVGKRCPVLQFRYAHSITRCRRSSLESSYLPLSSGEPCGPLSTIPWTRADRRGALKSSSRMGGDNFGESRGSM